MDKKDNCINCGAHFELHQYGTDHCPMNGREEARAGFAQKWDETKYCHKEDHFENLIQTIERASLNNKVTIHNVTLWAKSWREERAGKV